MKWLFDKTSKEADTARYKLYGEFRDLLIKGDFFNRYRTQGYSARDIASLMLDAITSERDGHLQCEKHQHLDEQNRAEEFARYQAELRELQEQRKQDRLKEFKRKK